jgi:membrane-bound serine protease (ClpP class)
VCLLVFFLGHLVVHLAGWEELLLFGVGVTLLVVEVFVTPGFGVVGVLGATAVLASLVMALVAMPLEISLPSGAIQTAFLRVLASIAGAVAAFALAAIALPHTRAGGPLVLRARLPLGASHGDRRAPAALSVGDEGTALTILRPAGKIRVGGISVGAVTEGDFIDRRARVVVVRIDGDRILVREKDS